VRWVVSWVGVVLVVVVVMVVVVVTVDLVRMFY
jgi:hypothetical protein